MDSKKPQKTQLELRTPKGTADYSPRDTRKLQEITETIKRVFEKHGGHPITTPTFELRSILLDKYGEETKLIYNLEDQGGDICSLRYDLTVPFTRYITANRIQKMRRYQIGNVFRRDNPSLKTGRLREFIQADFDICGSGIQSLQNAEVLSMISEILTNLTPRRFTIRINDRRILEGILGHCGIPREKYQTVCSTIDKTDKRSWEELEAEFKEKGLSLIQIDEIKKYIKKTDENEKVLEFIEEEVSESREAVGDLREVLRWTEKLGAVGIKVDLGLARGLDYYTGMIVEASYEGVEVGSVVGGGRYDRLCGSLGGADVPCVGFSVGVSRVFGAVEAGERRRGVFVGSAGGLMVDERLGVLRELWEAGARAETFQGRRVNFGEQMRYADEEGFAFGVFVGRREEEMGVLVVVDVESGRREQVSRGDIVQWLREQEGSIW